MALTVESIIANALTQGIHLFVDNGALGFKQKKGATFSAELKAQIVQNKTDIIAFLSRNQAKKVVTAPSIKKVERKDDVIPMSFAQQRLWMLDKIDGGSDHYNMPSALGLTGPVDLKALDRAFRRIVERHENLRTCYDEDESGQPSLVIKDAVDFAIEHFDLSGFEPAVREGKAQAMVQQEANVAFDFANDFMLKVKLLKLAEEDYILLVTMHHIASDGWSMGVLINEFSALYGAFSQAQPDPLPPLTIQYSDYAYWQREWLRGDVLEQQFGYWQKQLAGLPVAHSLPLDRPRPAVQSFSGKTVNSSLSKSTRQGIEQLVKKHNATLYMGMHAAFSVLLARYSNQQDIVVGSAVANREQPEIAAIIGFFVNNLVLRCDLSGNPSFNALIEQSKQTLLDAYTYQQVSFEQVVERIQPQRSLSHAPLFQVMLVLQNTDSGTLEISGLNLRGVSQPIEASKYDLTLHVVEVDSGLTLNWEYNTDLFDQASIECMARHFTYLLDTLLANPDKSVFSMPMLDAQEQRVQLADLNDTARDFPAHLCIHQLFEAQVAKTPDAVAVVFEQQQLSYRELNGRANRLAAYLVKVCGVKPDTLVGICLERSLDMVVALLAVVKAGGGYVPLDPDYPEVRLRYMLQDSQLATILSHSALASAMPFENSESLCLDDESFISALQVYSDDNIALDSLGLNSQHLAYVIYTSGSTGQPKGVMLPHCALVNRIDWMHKTYGMGSDDKVLQKTPYSFDVSVWEFFWPLIAGARIVLAKPAGHKEPLYLSSLIQQQGITKLHFVPSMLSGMLMHGDLSGCGSLEQVFCSGEALTVAQVVAFRTALPCTELHNLYGPTEAAIDVSSWDCSQPLGITVPIGKPIQNIQLMVLDQQLNCVPRGVVGELHIGGIGLARGYLNQDQLTQEKFIENPFYRCCDQQSSPRLYKTGDLVRLLENGDIEYQGRTDHQVKVRGFRIELGEIESALASHEAVIDVVVLAKDNNGDKRLVAYVTSDNSTAMLGDDDGAVQLRGQFIDSLRRQLAKNLPEYMIPAVFVVLATMPLSANGKIDRKVLPEPDISAQQGFYEAPRNDIEKALCQIWQQVLGLELVGIKDNFFELGGHSLLVMQVISQAKSVDISMTARQLFATPTLEDLALVVSENRDGDASDYQVPANLIEPGCDHITADMLPLIDLTELDVASIVERVPGGAENIQDIYPLAPLQEGILFHHRMSEGHDPYVLPTLFEVNDRTVLDGFLEALQFVIGRHDVLRTAVLWDDLPQPVQVVYRQAKLPVNWIELDHQQGAIEQMEALCEQDKQWINLTTAPLMQLQIAAEKSTGHYFVIMQLHHLIDDVTTLTHLQSDALAYMAKQQHSLPQTVPYRNFVANALHQAQQNDAKVFFRELLGSVEKPTLPFNLQDVHGSGATIHEHLSRVPEPLAVQLRAAAKHLKVSPAALFHAAWSMVVAYCSGSDDVVFGTVMSGRMQGGQGSENAVGMFINTLPMRVKLSGLSAVELVRQVQRGLRDLLPFEQTSLALAQNCSGLAANTPMFNVVLNYRHASRIGIDDIEAYQDTGIVMHSTHERNNYPITLSVDAYEEAFEIGVQVDEAVNAERLSSYMQMALLQLAESLTLGSSQAVQDMSILSAAEYQSQLHQFNDTAFDYCHEKCVHQLFEGQVAKTPDAVAIVFGQAALSYTELNQKANQLAAYLLDNHPIKPDTLVGICLERSLEMVVGLLAILKAGAAYVPIDPEYPTKRIQYMLDDANLTIVLTFRHIVEMTPLTQSQAVCLDDPQVLARCNDFSPSNIDTAELGLKSNHLAYAIYTSGSTGNPKGVMLEHRQQVNFLQSMARRPGCTAADRLLAVTSLSFDIHVLEIYLPLVCGGTLVVASNPDTVSPKALAGLIEQNEVTIMQATPSTWTMLLDDSWQPKTAIKLLCGGEAMPYALKDRLLAFDQVELWNMYGPTETCVWSATKKMAIDQPVTVGGPIGNTHFYVLDEHLRLLPQGVVGELYIGGSGLARGYLQRAELTADSFIVNPFYDETDATDAKRLYKTGDSVRWLAEGDLAVLGRVDHQVKIRGFRIETGEIEHRLVKHQSPLFAVKDAVVVANTSNAGETRLVAYLVVGHSALLEATEEQAKDLRRDIIAEVRNQLGDALPQYMVPSVFMLLDSLPLTLNGKVDRKALPDPDVSQLQAQYVAPSSASEILVVNIWQQILEVEKVGINDNFFELGGHSLSLMQMITALKSAGFVIGINDAWKLQTIKQLGEFIDLIQQRQIAQKQAQENIDPAAVMIDSDQCHVLDLTLEVAFNETHLRVAVNKMLSNKLLDHKVKQHNNQHFLVAGKRNRKERNEAWQVHEGLDPATFIDQQSIKLRRQVMSLNGALFTLAILNRQDSLVCVLVSHGALMNQSQLSELAKSFKTELISMAGN